MSLSSCSRHIAETEAPSYEGATAAFSRESYFASCHRDQFSGNRTNALSELHRSVEKHYGTVQAATSSYYTFLSEAASSLAQYEHGSAFPDSLTIESIPLLPSGQLKLLGTYWQRLKQSLPDEPEAAISYIFGHFAALKEEIRSQLTPHLTAAHACIQKLAPYAEGIVECAKLDASRELLPQDTPLFAAFNSLQSSLETIPAPSSNASVAYYRDMLSTAREFYEHSEVYLVALLSAQRRLPRPVLRRLAANVVHQNHELEEQWEQARQLALTRFKDTPDRRVWQLMYADEDISITASDQSIRDIQHSLLLEYPEVEIYRAIDDITVHATPESAAKLKELRSWVASECSQIEKRQKKLQQMGLPDARKFALHIDLAQLEGRARILSDTMLPNTIVEAVFRSNPSLLLLDDEEFKTYITKLSNFIEALEPFAPYLAHHPTRYHSPEALHAERKAMEGPYDLQRAYEQALFFKICTGEVERLRKIPNSQVAAAILVYGLRNHTGSSNEKVSFEQVYRNTNHKQSPSDREWTKGDVESILRHLISEGILVERKAAIKLAPLSLDSPHTPTEKLLWFARKVHERWDLQDNAAAAENAAKKSPAALTEILPPAPQRSVRKTPQQQVAAERKRQPTKTGLKALERLQRDLVKEIDALHENWEKLRSKRDELQKSAEELRAKRAECEKVEALLFSGAEKKQTINATLSSLNLPPELRRQVSAESYRGATAPGKLENYVRFVGKGKGKPKFNEKKLTRKTLQDWSKREIDPLRRTIKCLCAPVAGSCARIANLARRAAKNRIVQAAPFERCLENVKHLRDLLPQEVHGNALLQQRAETTVKELTTPEQPSLVSNIAACLRTGLDEVTRHLEEMGENDALSAADIDERR